MHASMLPMDQSGLPAYSSRHDRSIFDSVGSTSSRNGMKRHSHFASQHAFLVSDSGLEDYNHDSHFYSNGGRIGLAPELMDGYQSGHGMDNEYPEIRGYSSQYGVLHNRFDPLDGEDIDSIMYFFEPFLSVGMSRSDIVHLANKDDQRIISSLVIQLVVLAIPCDL